MISLQFRIIVILRQLAISSLVQKQYLIAHLFHLSNYQLYNLLRRRLRFISHFYKNYHFSCLISYGQLNISMIKHITPVWADIFFLLTDCWVVMLFWQFYSFYANSDTSYRKNNDYRILIVTFWDLFPHA